MDDQEHITYIINEEDANADTTKEFTNEVNINELLKKIDDDNYNDDYNNDDYNNDDYDFNCVQAFYPPSNDRYFAQISEYELNFTVKQLSVICEYYEIKTARMKKGDMIEIIVAFENNIENAEIIIRRKQMWHYIQQLKEDNFMKKFVFF